MTYGSRLPSSDSVNLGSNPSPPATGNPYEYMVSEVSRIAEQSAQTEQTAHTGRTKVGTAHTDTGTLNGQVYFITDGESIKVGWSGNPKERMRALQTKHPLPLRSIATTPGSIGDEHAIHALFSDIRLNGEWFRSTPELLKFIDDYCHDGARIKALRREIAQVMEHLTRQPKLDFYYRKILLAMTALFKSPLDKKTRKEVLASIEPLEASLAMARTPPVLAPRLTPEAMAALMAVSTVP
jgi:hypothetical protein